MTMTEEVDDWELLGLFIGIREPKYKYDKIKQKYEDPKGRKKALIALWRDTHPFASWSLLHQALSMMGETKTAKAIQKQYLQGQ